MPAEARGSGYFAGEVPLCKAETWRSPAPDLDGDGVADALVRVRTTFGADCRKPRWTLSRAFVLGADGALTRITWRGGPEEATEREIEAFVALSKGRVGVRGAVTHLPCCDQACTLTGTWSASSRQATSPCSATPPAPASGAVKVDRLDACFDAGLSRANL